MVRYLYEWIENLTVYMVLVTAAIQVIPGTGYKKYVRFFTGLILILMLMSPVLKIFGMDGGFENLYDSETYRRQVQKMEDAASYLGEVKIEDYLGKDYFGEDGASGAEDGLSDTGKEGETDAIEVEEIQVGRGKVDETDDK